MEKRSSAAEPQTKNEQKRVKGPLILAFSPPGGEKGLYVARWRRILLRATTFAQSNEREEERRRRLRAHIGHFQRTSGRELGLAGSPDSWAALLLNGDEPSPIRREKAGMEWFLAFSGCEPLVELTDFRRIDPINFSGIAPRGARIPEGISPIAIGEWRSVPVWEAR